MEEMRLYNGIIYTLDEFVEDFSANFYTPKVMDHWKSLPLVEGDRALLQEKFIFIYDPIVTPRLLLLDGWGKIGPNTYMKGSIEIEFKDDMIFYWHRFNSKIVVINKRYGDLKKIIADFDALEKL